MKAFQIASVAAYFASTGIWLYAAYQARRARIRYEQLIKATAGAIIAAGLEDGERVRADVIAELSKPGHIRVYDKTSAGFRRKGSDL